MKYLFIDFDGVLHPNNNKGELFTHSKSFCDALEPHKEKFSIVISSSWRESYDFEDIIEAFEPNLRDRVVGTTPILSNNMHKQGRYKEIIAFCEEHNISKNNWIAIDDMSFLFPKDCENLLLVNSNTGINSDDIQQIVSFVNSTCDNINSKKLKY